LVVNFRRSVIVSELWRPEVARIEISWAVLRFFWKNDPLWCNFQNSAPKVFTASPIDVVMFICRKNLSDGKSRVYYLTKKISTASQTVATARIAPKICQSQPPTMCSQWVHFGGVIAERVITVFCPVEYFHEALQAYKYRVAQKKRSGQ